MLKDHTAAPIVACSDLERAKHFYTETLGLPIEEEMDDLLTLRTGDSVVTVYRSDAAGSNRANAVVWDCGDQIAAVVADLKSRGVAFEHYPEMGMTIEGDLHVQDDFRAAWFKDPDGNILHINSM